MTVSGGASSRLPAAKPTRSGIAPSAAWVARIWLPALTAALSLSAFANYEALAEVAASELALSPPALGAFRLALGTTGCLTLALTLPVAAVGAGGAMLLLFAIIHRVCADAR